jgi:uncharacterized protein
MDLRSRLARLGYRPIGDAAAPAEPTEAPGAAPSPGGPASPPVHASPGGRGSRFSWAIDRVVSGDYISTPHGDAFVAEQRHPAGRPHGRHRCEEVLGVDRQVLSWLGRAPELLGMDPSRCVFLDIETTGLAGGTGTYAFLVGLAHFDGCDLVVRQLFMDDYDSEEAVLHALEGALEPFGGVVTFNGKSFDLSLLETRFLMARRRFPLRSVPHLDLLFPARRIWKGRLESCALSSLESAILGVQREDDVPGWMIPGIYFDYLRHGDARPLAPVFEHNRLDLLSMATLLARLARQYADPFHEEVENGCDLFSLGCAFEELDLPERAAACYQRAVALLPAGDARARAMARLGGLYKRLRLREDAAEVWRRLAAGAHGHATLAIVELAKHHEHVTREYLEAERLTLQALALLELRGERFQPWRVEQERRDLEHRLARLRRKMGRVVT